MLNKLDSQAISLLQDVLRKHQPALLPLVSRIEISGLNDEDRQAMMDAISNEFLETGLEDDDEPNPRGLALESLLDDLNRSWIQRD